MQISEVDEKNAGRYYCVVVSVNSYVKSDDAIVTVSTVLFFVIIH